MTSMAIRPTALGSGAPQAGRSAADTMSPLRRIPFFADVADDLLARLAGQARWQHCPAGAVVVDSGDPSDEVYFVMEGALRVVVRTPHGHEAILNDLSPGEFFGELAAIDGVRRSANVTALVSTRLCVVPGAAFLELVLNSPVAGRRLLRLLATRLRAKDERMLESAALPARQRLIAELLRLSRDRGGGERVLSPPPAQHVLAARIGTRRETVSRELAKMARGGLLTLGRRAIVLHRPAEMGAEVGSRLRGSEAD